MNNQNSTAPNRANINGASPPSAPTSYNAKRVVEFLELLDHEFADGVTEIRILLDTPTRINGQWTGKVVAGYYEPSQYEKAARDIAQFDGHGHIYATINPVNPDLLARACNRLQYDAKATANEGDIIRRLWLPFDIDPKRPAGISSTDEELEKAIEVRDAVVAALRALGFDVITGLSGNGAHALVRIDEPAESETVKAIISQVSVEHSTPDVHVDTAVCNASRIWKIYGTLACKGDNIEARPHRRAELDAIDAMPQPQDLAKFPMAAPDTEPESVSARAPQHSHADDVWARGYVLSGLKKEAAKMQAAGDGERHEQRLDSAMAIGGYVPWGLVSEDEIFNALCVNFGADRKNAEKTIRDGIAYGIAKRRDYPQRTHQHSDTPVSQDYLASNEAIKSEPKPPKFPRVTLSEVFARPRLEYLIQGMFVEQGTGVISADYGGFKSLLALDMGLCVALGKEWMDRATKRGNVVYITPEGAYTIADRVKAWMIRHNVTELPENFEIIELPVQIGDATQCQLLIDELRELNPAFIILDTVAKCNIGRDENDAAAMGEFTNGMETISRELNAFLLAIHHNNKNGTARGSVSLPANVDASITLKRSPGLVTTVGCDRVKGAPFEDFSLIGRKVEIGEVDENGEQVTSLVFELTDTPASAMPQVDRTRDRVFDALFDSGKALTSGEWHAETGLKSRSQFTKYRDELLGNRVVKNGQRYIALTEMSDTSDLSDSDKSDGIKMSDLSGGAIAPDERTNSSQQKDKPKSRGKNSADAEPYKTPEIREGEL